MNIIELRHVTHVYSRGTPFEMKALDDIHVGFEKGKITGIIGHTGSGKSTMVGLFNGLIRPTEGEVLFHGEDIWKKPKNIRDIRFRIGLVMQYPEYQLFDETVRSDIGFALRNQGLAPDVIEERVQDAIQDVGLDASVLDASPFDLSGGQKRRVAIAGILAMQPEVLVMDEPAAGLDPRGRRDILGSLDAYRKRHDATVILVSHSMEDMAAYCENVVVMNHANVLAQGTTREIFSHPEILHKVGLDIPQVAQIAALLRERGIPLTGELYTVEGLKQAILSYQAGRGTMV